MAEGQETACLYCERICERCRYPITGGWEHVEQPQPEGSRYAVCSLRRVVRPLVENLTMFLDHQRHTAHKPAPAP